MFEWLEVLTPAQQNTFGFGRLERLSGQADSRAFERKAKSYNPNTDDVIENIEFTNRDLIQTVEQDLEHVEEEDNEDKVLWSTAELQTFRGCKAISEAIKELNEDALFSQAVKSSKFSDDDWPDRRGAPAQTAAILRLRGF